MDRDRRRPRLLGPHRRSVSTLGTGARCVVLAVAVVAASFSTDAGAAGGRTTARSVHTSSAHASSAHASSVSSSAHASSVSSSGAGGGPALVLLAQTSWVTAGQPFDLHLRVSPGLHDLAALGLSVDVFPCLSTVSGFDQSVSADGPQSSPASSTTQPIPLQSLPSLGADTVDLSMPVVVDSSAVPGAPFTVDLVPTAGQCQAFPSGIFPVRVQLVDLASGSAVGTLVTHLVYNETTGTTEPLRVAVVLPLDLSLGPGVASVAELATRPQAALARLAAGAIASVTGAVAAAAGHPTVPLTVSVGGQTLEALSAAGRQVTLDQLSDLAGDTSGHQVLFAPFVPVDATALVDTGLADELALQVARSAQVSAPVTHETPAPATPVGLGTWVATGALDGDTVAALDTDGFRQLVVPPSAVSQPPTNGSTAVPFTVSGSGGSQLEAVAADTDLAGRFTAASSDPVLAAHQLVAELAQIFFEKPYADVPRGVVVLPPAGWTASPAFVSTLLAALGGSPLLDPVTVDGLFAAVPASTSCHLDCRLVAGGSTSLPAGAIVDQRRRINAFFSAAQGPAGRTVTVELSDLVLAGQSDLLRPAAQASVVAAAGRAIDAQLQHVVVQAGPTVTLTSQQGSLPVTVTSSAPYAVKATLTLSSDKLLFPGGTTQWTRPGTVTLLPAPHTNVISVPVRTRGSGLFPVDVVLRSPAGGLQLSSGTLDIRSTAASVVGIVLSAGAVVVLAVWWFRTSRRRRAARRTEEADEPRQVPVGVP